MVDLSLVVGFDWDAGNARKSVDRHGVTQGDAEAMFFLESLLVVDDPGHGLAEPRFHALGCIPQGLLLQAAFTLRGGGTLLRVISVRSMSRRERRIHANAT